jgi:hypothetical protein
MNQPAVLLYDGSRRPTAKKKLPKPIPFAEIRRRRARLSRPEQVARSKVTDHAGAPWSMGPAAPRLALPTHGLDGSAGSQSTARRAGVARQDAAAVVLAIFFTSARPRPLPPVLRRRTARKRSRISGPVGALLLDLHAPAARSRTVISPRSPTAWRAFSH